MSRENTKCVVCGGSATLIDRTDRSGKLVSFCKTHEIYAQGKS